MTKDKLLSTFVLLSLIGLLSCASNQTNNSIHILKPSIGLDSLKLDQLTLADIKTKFGDNFKTDTFYVNPIIAPSSLDSNAVFKKEIFSFRLFYDSLGLSFFFKPDESKITAIRVEQPFKAQTDKGIILDKSTFGEVVKTYGNSPWVFTGKYILKEHKGVRFYRQFYLDMATSDTILNKYLDSAVTEISIHNVRGQ